MNSGWKSKWFPKLYYQFPSSFWLTWSLIQEDLNLGQLQFQFLSLPPPTLQFMNFTSARSFGSLFPNLLSYHFPCGEKKNIQHSRGQEEPSSLLFTFRIMNKKVEQFEAKCNNSKECMIWNFPPLTREDRTVKYHFWLQVSCFMDLMAFIWKKRKYNRETAKRKELCKQKFLSKRMASSSSVWLCVWEKWGSDMRKAEKKKIWLEEWGNLLELLGHSYRWGINNYRLSKSWPQSKKHFAVKNKTIEIYCRFQSYTLLV